ncbi:M60 family metallopeptidase [Pseudomonas syringae]|uniref:Peptidase M60-like domain protein n=1 Tax=Pseudomonas syringae UB303 TaxID=1357287 RepID=A0AAJ4E6N4_PSESX|nr:M60 family metallopeptidase [Pseudomonas syringae]KTB81381.1 peptidase M60-like domain protein [Pseudomonas syringae ICMP 13102]KTB82109.1 peptidase M60-like domain protein [Pseudomonas syringae pv. syringae PD2774]KWS10172.1 peptidase M60-like domain protein [Pseudomonas syringae pv. syringae]MCH5513393.1 M60 family metallopeptidase [Pseudomonas syringae pv. syringae]MCH5555145.1 M60 family metallopeptidase [Pseudomonas syringae pv. syringae]
MDDRHPHAASSVAASAVQAQTRWQAFGFGSAESHRERHARARAHTDFQPTNIYVTKGDQLEITATSLYMNRVSAVIGVPELDTPTSYPLQRGLNVLVATNTGLLGFTNLDPLGHVVLDITGQYNHVPFFRMDMTNLEWEQQMAQYSNAPVVLLTSPRAIVVVRYQSAQLYLTDPAKLMGNFDDAISAQDGISGVINYSTTEWALDPSKHFYVEADRLYMFAMDGHMGFNGSAALARLLSTAPEDGWGPWHESGHQRQLSPMTWGTGTGMTEVTVNLYSMAAQEVFLGRATGADSSYAPMKEYLASSLREYDNIKDSGHKLVMLWQLRLSFGTSFYPQLHQRYRLMHNPPTVSDDKAQRFIVETSLLSHVNLAEFFDRWGLYPNPETLNQIADLPALTLAIWETDADTTIPIPLPLSTYIPELAHILSSVNGTFQDRIKFTVAEQWYTPYRYEITLNGTLVASVDHGECVGCEARIEEGIAYVEASAPISEGDEASVKVFAGGKLYAVASTASRPILLFNIKAMFTDDRCAELRPGITQPRLDVLFFNLDEEKTDELHGRLLNRAQRLLLQKTIRSVIVSAGGVQVTFEDEVFKNHDYTILLGATPYATLEKGYPSESELVNNAWICPCGVGHQEVTITAAGGIGKTYTLFSGNVEQAKIALPIRQLFTDHTMNRLAEGVDQASVDALYMTVNGNPIISVTNRAFYRSYLVIAQSMLLRLTVAKVIRTDDVLDVYFEGDTFKNHNYKLFVNDLYASEITQGRAYYSTVSNRVWTSREKFEGNDHCRVDVEYQGVVTTLYESNAADAMTASALQEGDVTQCGLEKF